MNELKMAALNLFSTYYTCEILTNGRVAGSAVERVWVWQSPALAHRKLIEISRELGTVVNFRKVR